MNNLLVSVIIPNFNHARYLDERIQSVLKQTYQNFEVIILDDKSTDNSLEVINKYKDNPHIAKIVVNEKNSGSTFKQWHKGFELAKGELIWIAESDDSCDKNFLSTLVPIYRKNNASIAFVRSVKMDSGGNLKGLFPYQEDLMDDITLDGKQFISEYLYRKNLIMNASATLFDKKIAMQIDKGYINFKGSGDWLFWIEIAEHGSVCFVNKNMNYFRIHENNTTIQIQRTGKDFFENYDIFQYLLSHKLISNKKAQNRRCEVFDTLRSMHVDKNTKRSALILWGYNNPLWRLLYLSKRAERYIKRVINM